jgi:flagellar biosynthesis/type III secretory pathway M-ring protein FliF/YscJ
VCGLCLGDNGRSAFWQKTVRTGAARRQPSKREREKRLERLREAMRERGEDVAKLVRTWINEKEDQ